ncbi:MAG: hypothetical protein DDT34_01916 [Firmicutes bacterium]|nr:hypothetical protein [Bacillota bacterium]
MESGIKNAVPQLTGNSPTPAIPVLIATESKLDVSTPTPGRGVESGVENIRPRANDPQKLSVSPRAEGGAIVPNPAITEPNYPAITSTPIIPTNSVRTPAEAANVGESGGLETLVRAGRGDEIAPVNTETTSPTINTLVESVKPSGIAKMTVAIRAPVTAHEQNSARSTFPRLGEVVVDRQAWTGLAQAKSAASVQTVVATTVVARGAEAEIEPARQPGVAAKYFPRTPVVTPTVSPAFIRELSAEIIAFAQNPTRATLTLEVTPREYGRVIVSAEMEQGVAIIRLVTETVAAKIALLENLPRPTPTLEVRIYTADEYREWAENPQHGRPKEDGQEHRQPRKKESNVEFKV